MMKILIWIISRIAVSILETPSLQAGPRSTPQLPAFTAQSREWNPHHLTTRKAPVLQTSLRARPPTVKSSVELEKEELEKIPKFKARPLNKKILESKGGLGIFCNKKRQITVPEEFHFSLDKRIPPPLPANVGELSLNSVPYIPKPTNPKPFSLLTEERGAEKERNRAMKILHKHIEEERSRVPKASPYPYTTDFPEIPKKPEPKPSTKPEPFQLESLVRHEEEMQRKIEKRRRLEREEVQKRVFRAQPILKEDPIPLPEKERRPLTKVQEFDLHVQKRALDRAKFDKKIKEKEMIYKKYREEAELARMMEEEKALKQMRRMMVPPRARPVPKFDHPFLPQRCTEKQTISRSIDPPFGSKSHKRSERQKAHPSPISVLEARSSPSGSEGFRGVFDGIQELRTQLELQLLKMDSAQVSTTVTNDDDFLPQIQEDHMLNVESWEDMYIVDLLINSGLEKLHLHTFNERWRSLQIPVCASVFDTLEKKYSDGTTESRSERKLLFDRINSALEEIFLHDINSPQIFDSNGQNHSLKDEFKRSLATDDNRTEWSTPFKMLDIEMEWSSNRSDIFMVGEDIERILIDELIMEILSI